MNEHIRIFTSSLNIVQGAAQILREQGIIPLIKNINESGLLAGLIPFLKRLKSFSIHASSIINSGNRKKPHRKRKSHRFSMAFL
jgi:hypothetical protein